MRSHYVELQVNVDIAGGDLGEMAYRWLDEISMARASEVRAAVADRPARIQRARSEQSDGVIASLHVVRSPQGRPRRSWDRVPSQAGLKWLRDELTDVPRTVRLTLGRVDDEGKWTADTVTVLVERHAAAPETAVLTTYLRESELTDAHTGTTNQRFYLDLLAAFADRTNPAYGHIAYAHDGWTAFEAGLRNVDTVPPVEWWHYPTTLRCCREALRGYSWLTILPQELLPRVGGVQALTASGAFVEVRELQHGGVWLLATADYRQFDDAALMRVFRALAPVLRPGPITVRPPAPDEPPWRVVGQDARAYGASSSQDH